MSDTEYYYYYTDDGEPTPPPDPPPSVTVAPAIQAGATVNTANTGTRGTWLNADTYADQWQQSNDGVAGWADIAGATALNYTPTPALYQKYLRRRETATGPGGSTIAYSNVSNPVNLPAMSFSVTTTGVNQTLTLQELRTVIGEEIEVTWGDGQSNFYTSSGSTGNQRTHLYAAAGTYTVTINLPDMITHFDIRDTKISQVTGANISLFRNLQNLRILTVPATALQWTVGTAAPMPPLIQYIQVELQNNFVWTVNADMPDINDVLNFRGIPGLTWVIDAPNPIPVLTESFTIRECPGVDYVSSAEDVHDLSVVRFENGMSQAEVDAFLLDIYAGFALRTVTGGTIDVAGGSPANAAPSGTLAAQCPPVTGKAAAYELVNDSCGISTNHWAGVTTA